MRLLITRTEAGDNEVFARKVDLSTDDRALLDCFDGALTVDEVLSGIPNAQLTHVMRLLELGLVRPISFRPPASAAGNSPQYLPLLQSILQQQPEDLYVLLTQQAKRSLGLIQAFRMILKLERFSTHHERRAVAVVFIDEIWRAHGVNGLRPLERLLALPSHA